MRVLLIAQTQVTDLIPDYIPQPTLEHAADELAEQAGRLCYLSYERPNAATAETRHYLANIIRQGHFSVLEHASATFYIDGVTRAFTHELIRHRHLSFSEVSQRYVDVSGFEFAQHPGLAEIGDSERELLNDALDTANDAYDAIFDNLTGDHGYGRKEARQAARHVLPSGMETKILVTGNHRAWRDVLAKRLSPMADAEFQAVAREILRQLIKIAPGTYQDFGAWV